MISPTQATATQTLAGRICSRQCIECVSMIYRARARQRSQEVGLPCQPTIPPPTNRKIGVSTATNADTESLSALNPNEGRRHLLQRVVTKPSGAHCAQSTTQHTVTPSAKRSETAKTVPTRALRHGV